MSATVIIFTFISSFFFWRVAMQFLNAPQQIAKIMQSDPSMEVAAANKWLRVSIGIDAAIASVFLYSALVGG